MKAGSSIKILRQNFLKKHELPDNYFISNYLSSQTQSESTNKKQEERQFNDKQIFYPKQFQRKNGKKKQQEVDSKQDLKIKNRGLIKKMFGQQFQTLQPKLAQNIFKKSSDEFALKNKPPIYISKFSIQGDQISSKNGANVQEPMYIKKQKQIKSRRERASSARFINVPLKSVTKTYTKFMMQSCSIEAVKIQSRPLSAFQSKDLITQNQKHHRYKSNIEICDFQEQDNYSTSKLSISKELRYGVFKGFRTLPAKKNIQSSSNKIQQILQPWEINNDQEY